MYTSSSSRRRPPAPRSRPPGSPLTGWSQERGHPDRAALPEFLSGQRYATPLKRRGVLGGPPIEQDWFPPGDLLDPVGERVEAALAHRAPDIDEGIDVGAFAGPFDGARVRLAIGYFLE